MSFLLQKSFDKREKLDSKAISKMATKKVVLKHRAEESKAEKYIQHLNEQLIETKEANDQKILAEKQIHHLSHLHLDILQSLFHMLHFPSQYNSQI